MRICVEKYTVGYVNDWHDWFAWYPVRVDGEDGKTYIVWLEYVKRQQFRIYHDESDVRYIFSSTHWQEFYKLAGKDDEKTDKNK